MPRPADSARDQSSSTTTTSRPNLASRPAATVALKPERQYSQIRPAGSRAASRHSSGSGTWRASGRCPAACSWACRTSRTRSCGDEAYSRQPTRRTVAAGRPVDGRAEQVHPADPDADLGQVVHGHLEVLVAVGDQRQVGAPGRHPARPRRERVAQLDADRTGQVGLGVRRPRTDVEHPLAAPRPVGDLVDVGDRRGGRPDAGSLAVEPGQVPVVRRHRPEPLDQRLDVLRRAAWSARRWCAARARPSRRPRRGPPTWRSTGCRSRASGAATWPRAARPGAGRSATGRGRAGGRAAGRPGRCGRRCRAGGCRR